MVSLVSLLSLFLLFNLSVTQVLEEPPNAKTTQPANEEDNNIYFHLVCHSHDDVGWSWTPDKYYTTRVRSILTTVVKAL